MSRWILRWLLFLVLSPALLYAASLYLPGIAVRPDGWLLFQLGIVLSVVNFVVWPLLRFFLKPFILITFGLVSVPLNMALLSAALRFIPALELEGLLPLLELSLLLGAFNTLLAFFTR